MKKFIFLIICAVIISVLCVGCGGTYNAAIISPPTSGSTSGSDSGSDPSGDDGEESTYVSTVTLTSEGEVYAPPAGAHIKARWASLDDANFYFDAEFNTLGVATVSGLDGDYRITLSDIPSNYTYNPNGNYRVTAKSRDLNIDLFPITPTTGTGKGLYESQGCIILSDVGTYRAKLDSASDIMYYEYRPNKTGYYHVQSWIDTSANEVNPYIERYNGTFAAKYLAEEVDDGGDFSTYTKNFKMEVNCPKGYIGNSWTFAIHANCISEELYPVYVDFTISYEGEAIAIDGRVEVQVANGPFAPCIASSDGASYPIKPSGTFHEFANSGVNLDNFAYERRLTEGTTDSYEIVPLIGLGEDGFYHKYNSATQKFDGDTIYVKLTNAGGVGYFFTHADEGIRGDVTYDDAFWHCNYFHPEEAWDERMDSFPLKLGVGDYNTDEFFYKDYHQFISQYTGKFREPNPDPEGGRDVIVDYPHPDSKDPKKMVAHNADGYFNRCNADGTHPLNEELKVFLQEYAEHYGLFKDGDGKAELIGLNASEDYMWLFCCGTYY